ncbi:sensor histidine kinase [Paenibacillus sp. UMB4589-SE434]|uniref:cache domain-containing sensor histidine kinase n=1 Tax=Paenibacillus sp. UMB4589-SE434 TaxID=3046314 RepID=UPI00254A4C00|nr:sensor histidine kinase [Paenibacillus sp. UMB4589-SE434]MDK8182196.1 sensor histidine kinase [Paenibacillus sp. UMB4589-SE434]
MARGFRTIHGRLFILLFISMMSLLLIVSVLYYKRATDLFHTKISSIAEKSVSQTVNYYDLLLKGYDSLTKSITGNLDIQRLIADTRVTDSALRMINTRTITNLLGAIYYSRKDIIGIHVMSYTGSFYSYENYINAIDQSYASSPWYRQLKQSNGELIWLGVYDQSIIDRMETRSVFAFGRQMYDLTQHKPIGIVLIEMDSAPIMSALDNLRLSANSDVTILARDGVVVASTKGSSTSKSDPTAMDRGLAPSNSYAKLANLLLSRDVLVNQQMDYMLVAAKPTMADWIVYSETPEKDLNVELDQTKNYLLLVISILIVVAMALAIFVSRTISSPLKRLIHEMRRVERGHFKGELQVQSYEEINILVSSFNQMVNQMDELIERVKVSSISEKNAQLQALQSQVNPHFLYNTLDMIYWMLDEKENDRLGSVVLSLSHLFRYSSNWEDSSQVTLREELEQMRHYLTIIASRLEGRLSLRIHIDEQYLDAPLPKMTLQPIIENAVKYGLEPLPVEGKLNVYCQASDQALYIIIQDNGIGIVANRLTELQEALRQVTLQAVKPDTEPAAAIAMERKGRKGVGLLNVHRRLVLMYGENFGIQLDSTEEKGTTIRLSMPLPSGSAEHVLPSTKRP